MRKISEYYGIKDAAEFLGIDSETLRRWGIKKLVRVRRGPGGYYRLFAKEDLEKILQDLEDDGKV